MERETDDSSGRFERAWTWPAVIAVTILAATGCSPFQLAHRTLHGELNQFPRLTDGRASCRLYKQWAQQEWAQIASDSPEAFSDDYESGFLQGFIDHVYAGGRLVPPTMPPRRYWRLPYRNAQGQLAIREWYAGFEHGARVAHENGYRERAVIPSSVLPGAASETNAPDPGDWIELDNSGPIDGDRSAPEPTPAAPAAPAAPTMDEPPAPEGTDTPAAEPLTGPARQLTPGGLPIPADAPTTLGMRARSAEPATAKPTRPRADATVSGEVPPALGQASQAAHGQATGLPLKPAAEGPPPPPWVADASDEAADGSPQVRLASAQAPAVDAEAPGGVDQENPRAQPSEARLDFDPFAGTRFAALSQDAAQNEDAPSTRPIAGEVSQKSAEAAASGGAPASGSSGAWVAARTEPPAAGDSMPSVKPLEAIVPPPGKSLATLTLPDGSGADLKPLPSEETVAEKQESKSQAPNSRSSGSTGDEAEQPANRQTSPRTAGPRPIDATSPGWQSVPTEPPAAWKAKL